MHTRHRLAGLATTLALVATLGLAGSASGATAGRPAKAPALAAVGVAGAWTLTIDWYCDGTIATSAHTFNADGTWISVNGSFTHTGRWFQVGSTIVWTFDDLANLLYTAQVNAGFMSGVHGYNTAGGATGCFGAVRSTTAAAAALAKTSTADPQLPR